MSTRQISIELLHADASAEIVLDVEFRYRAGSPASFYDPGDGPEVEIEHIYWPYERPARKDERGFPGMVKDHYDVPVGLLPVAVYEAIEADIIENHNPADDYPDDF